MALCPRPHRFGEIDLRFAFIGVIRGRSSARVRLRGKVTPARREMLGKNRSVVREIWPNSRLHRRQTEVEPRIDYSDCPRFDLLRHRFGSELAPSQESV